MGAQDFEVPEVPIPARILEEKRASIRRAKRVIAAKQGRKKVRTTSNRSVKKAS